VASSAGAGVPDEPAADAVSLAFVVADVPTMVTVPLAVAVSSALVLA